MPERVLAFDFGTSYFKAALVDAAGTILHVRREPTPITRVGPRSEIDPRRFKQIVIDMVRSLASQSPDGLADVRVVSFCTQANTFILLDANDEPLTPLIVWDDARAIELQPWLDQWTSEMRPGQITGIGHLTHQFSPAKFRFLADHNASLWKRVRRICFLGDYFTRWLTGAHATDASIAAMSGLFDVQSWRWSAELCDRVGVNVDWLPEVIPSGSNVGTTRNQAADDLGLPADCQMVMGCLDQHAGAIGVGNLSPGSISETTGTVLATVRCVDAFRPAEIDSPILCGPAGMPGRFYLMVAGDTSANLLESYRNLLPDRPSFEQLDQAAAAYTEDIPQLAWPEPGEDWREPLRQWATTQPPGQVVRAIHQAVANALAEQVHLLAGDDLPTLIHCAGGAAKSRLWLTIKANTLGIPMRMPTCEDPALLGAAALAAPVLKWGAMKTYIDTIAPGELIQPPIHP